MDNEAAPPSAVMVLEDEPSTQHLIRVVLEAFDIPVAVTASTLSEALTFIDGRPDIDLVICDLNLPDSVGVETVLALRDRLAHAPIVVATADEVAGRLAVAAGADDMVLKDSLFDDLATAVHHSVQRRGNRWLAPLLARAQAFEQSGVPQAIIDADGTIVHVNHAFRVLAGRPGQPGRPIGGVFAEGTLPKPGSPVPLADGLGGLVVDVTVDPLGRTGRTSVSLGRPRAAPQPSVLFVEDDHAQRALTTTLLEALGYSVGAVPSMFDALELLHRQPESYDIVVTDLGLPDSSGGRSVEALIAAAPLPVVVFSGSQDPAVAERSLHAGAAAFVAKDDGVEVLHRAIIEARARPPLTSAALPASWLDTVGVPDFMVVVAEALSSLHANASLDGWVLARRVDGHWVVVDVAGSVPDVLARGSRHGAVASLATLVSEDEDSRALPDVQVGLPGVESIIGAPLVLSGQGLVGALLGVGAATAGELANLEWTVTLVARQLSSLLSMELDRERLSRDLDIASAAARIDPMTGLSNRRAWEMRLRTEEARCQRTGSGAGIVLIDLDGLKEINDARGHEAGDDLLRMTASTISGTLRADDVAFRLGGDEFAILCPTMDDQSLETLVRRLLVALDRASIAASLGYSSRHPNGTLAATVASADAAMYEVKQHGGRGARRGRESRLTG